MPKLTKNQTQLLVLGALFAAIVGVLIWYLSKGGGEAQQASYQPQSVSTDIDSALFAKPEFRRLRSPVILPLEPGQKGRPNPFEPF